MKSLLAMMVLVAGSVLAQSATPRILAHRGGRAEYDDNARGGFVKCLSENVLGYETDIRITKDQKLVIMHDGNMERTTEGKGTIEEMTLAEIQAVKLKRSQEPVPSTEQVMEVFKGRKDIDIELEMKAYGPAYQGEKMEIYCRLLHDAAVKILEPGTYTFTSFNHDAISTMKRLFPDAPVGLIRGNILTKEYVDTAKKLGCVRVAPLMRTKEGECTKEAVDYAHANGMKVTGWMVEDLATYMKARSLGIDCTTSDHPMRLLKEVNAAK